MTKRESQRLVEAARKDGRMDMVAVFTSARANREVLRQERADRAVEEAIRLAPMVHSAHCECRECIAKQFEIVPIPCTVVVPFEQPMRAALDVVKGAVGEELFSRPPSVARKPKEPKAPKQTPFEDCVELIKAVREYACLHYEEGKGWDILVETMSDQDIYERMWWCETPKGAINIVSRYLKTISSYQADIQASGL